MLEVRLLGQPDVRCDGVSVKFAKRTATLSMLAYVILRRGQPVSREALAYVVFPEQDEATALAELRRYLYLANKALPVLSGSSWLLVDAETVRWNDRAGAFVDVVEFERLATDPKTHAEALGLYGGDLLEDVYEDWVVAERERLRSRFLQLLNELLESHQANRDFQAAIGYAKRILAADAWREDTLRALVSLRYQSGDTAGALAEYERFAKRLRDDLAIAPMPETVALRHAIVNNETIPGSVTPAKPIDGAAPPSVVLPFVGRSRELAKLHAAWSRAARGTGCFVLVSGEAGAGKTRLIAELSRIVQSEGGRVMAGTTSAPEALPYQSVIEALRSVVPLLESRPMPAARRRALARLLPEIRDPDVAAEIPERTAEAQTARIHDALIHALKGLVSPRPVMMVVEDVHWAGAATLEALGAVVREMSHAPLLVVATCRDEETAPGHPVRALQRSLTLSAHVDEIHVERLTKEDVAGLLATLGNVSASGDDLVQHLYAQSEGNALFLNEAIAAVLERPSKRPGVPSSVTGLIEARVAALGDEARSVADIAAVAGSGFTVSLVREVSNLPAAAVARGIDELLDRRMLREAGARATNDYVFGHHLFAEAIYGRIEPAFRSQRHARIALILERSYREGHPALPREIARHYEGAGELERASEWYLNAAAAAAAIYAYGDVIELASRSLETASSDDRRRSALDVRERARGRRGDRHGQRDDIDALERLAADGAQALFDVARRRALLARGLGESDEEERSIRRMHELADGLDSDAARAEALAQAATHAGLRSRPSDGLEPARIALATYERLGDVRGQLDCLYLLVDFTSNVGDLENSRRYLETMRERASTVGDRAVEARALAVAATAALLQQHYRECYDLTVRGLEVQVAINDREGEAASRGRLAVTAAWLADYPTALREFERALKAYEVIGHKRGLAHTYTNRALLLMRLGLMRETLDSIERSNALFDVVHEKRTIVVNQVNASFVHLHLGEHTKAKTLAKTALAAAREIAYPVFEAAALANLGNAERALGELGAAIEHMEAGIAIRRPIQSLRDFADDLADLTIAYASAGRNGDARRTARELLTLENTGYAGSLWPHYIWWAAAHGLSDEGDAGERRRCADRARSELNRFAETIDDSAARAALMSLPISQRIAAGGLPEPSVRRSPAGRR